MIQRIQSVYLLLAFISSALLLYFPIYELVVTIGGDESSALFGGNGLVMENGEGSSFPFYLLFITMAMLSIIALFFYKNRKKQLLVARLNLILNGFVVIGFFAFSLFGKSSLKEKVVEMGQDLNDVEFNFGIGYYLLFVSIPFIILAIRGIRRDDSLIKSLDRLR